MPRAAVRPQVKVGGRDLNADADNKIDSVVVDTSVHLPDMFEVTFRDDDGNVLLTGNLGIGKEVEILVGPTEPGAMAKTLVKGEITSVEGDYYGNVLLTRVRGYSKAHRLQKARKTLAYPNKKVSDVARLLATQAGLMAGTIDDTGATHDVISQVAQTDWEFLKSRAREHGFEMGVGPDGKFFFRKPSSASGGGGLGGLASAVGVGGAMVLEMRANLHEFRPRVSAAAQVESVTVRSYDPEAKEPLTGQARAGSVTASLDAANPADLATSFGAIGGLPFSPPSIPSLPGLPSLGLPDTGKGYTMVDHPLISQREATTLAEALAEHIGSTFAEAEGLADGHPDIQAGAVIEIKGTPSVFQGKWVVTCARHTVGGDGEYVTHFVVSGRQDRSLLGLASLGASNGEVQGDGMRISGLVPAIVLDNNDRMQQGRVKVTFPWLGPTYISDWIRVAQLGAGFKGGAMWLPEPKDEVLVGFEFGDFRRPYVISGLYNKKDTTRVQAPGVVTGAAKWRGFQSRQGHTIAFLEEMNNHGISVTTKDDKITMLLEATRPGQEQVTIEIKGSGGGGALITANAMGAITVEAKGTTGSISLKGSTINIEAQQQLNLKGSMVNLEATGAMAVKGKPIQLN